MVYRIVKIFSFEGGHQLVHHQGKCQHPHGHHYVLHVHLKSLNLQEAGSQKNMVLDFGDLDQLVKPMIEKYFDHRWINDTLETDSPTAEFIARWIYHHLLPFLPKLEGITLYETPTCYAQYGFSG